MDNPIITYYSSGNKSYEGWYINGKYHREDGPAYQQWYENGKINYEEWLLNNNRHREDGPAVQWWYGNGNKRLEEWYLNGKRHRENGPAYIEHINDKTIKKYYKHGKDITDVITRKLKLEKIL
jgi:antitoxin component YwqK of YwqJK toxin-antitoxin module